MAKWTFEPGHTAAAFCVRHMMVTFVRGHFKDVHGSLEFDPDDPKSMAIEATIDASLIDSGEKDRDGHLRAEDFLDVANHPHITFRGSDVDVLSSHDFIVRGDLTLRGVTKPVELRVSYLGQWPTPWWVDDEDKGPKMRAGFVAETAIDRRDFDITWDGELERGGSVVGSTVEIVIDAEAILED